MSEQSSKDADAVVDEKIDDDPLAELARIVSAGSVFGAIPTTDPEPQKAPVPEVKMPVLDEAIPDASSGEASNGPFVDEIQQPAIAESTPEALPDDLELDIGTQLEEELFNELQRDPDISQAGVATKGDGNLDAVVSELAVAPLEISATDAQSGFETPENMTQSQPVAANVAANLGESSGAIAAEQVAGQAAEAPKQPDAIEEALNLDSFFDAEFAAATESINPAAAPAANTVTNGQADNFAGAAVMADAGASVMADEASLPPVYGDADPLDSINLEAENEHFSFDEQEEVQPKRGKLFMSAAAVLLVAVVGGSAAYFLFGAGADGDSDVVIAASDDPVRVKPTDPGGKTIPDQNRTVYEAISGTEKTDDSGLVDRSEELIVGVEGEAEQEAPRVVLGNRLNDPISSTKPPAGPRTVRTVVIRPDGSIVPESDTPPAVRTVQDNNQVSPQVNLPTTTDVETASSEQVAPATSIIASNQDTLVPRTVEAEPVTEALLPTEPEINRVVPPLPRVRTARLAPRETVSQQQNEPVAIQPRAQQTTRVPAASTPQTSANGSFVVQLSSQRSAEQAITTFKNLQRRFSVLSPYSPIVKRADLGQRGVFHRLQVGRFNTRGEAVSLCENLKAAGGDCIVSKS